MNTSAAVDVFRELYAAINDNDLDRAVTFYAPDVHYVDPSFDLVLHGRPKVREHLKPWFDTADLTAEMDDAFAAGDHVASAWRLSGSITQELPGVWTREAVGRSFSVSGLTLATHTSDGLLGEVAEYRDISTVLKQIGGVPLPTL